MRSDPYKNRVAVMDVGFPCNVASLLGRQMCLFLRLLRRMTLHSSYLMFVVGLLFAGYQCPSLACVDCDFSLRGAVCFRRSTLLGSADRRPGHAYRYCENQGRLVG